MTAKKSFAASLRFIAMVLGLAVIFGLGGSLILAAFDKEQTGSRQPLFDIGVMVSGTIHFFQVLVYVVVSGTDHVGNPFRTILLSGFATTIEFCFIAMPLALAGGFVLALMSQSRFRFLRLPTRAFVEFIRNTPLLVQMLVIYYGLASLPHTLVNPFTASVATLTINYCAYECENLRAGLAAVDRGQTEAATSLGLSSAQTLRLVILPQMIPISLPTVVNDFIYMFKDSSILSIIAVLELTAESNGLSRRFPEYSWQFYAVGALLYLALSLPLGRLARALESRLRGHSFAVGQDLTALTWRSLVAFMVAGWIAGAVALGVSFSNFAQVIEQTLFGVALTLMVLVGIMLLLGIPVYLIGWLVTLLRAALGDRKAGPAGPAKSSGAVAVKSN